MRGIEVTDLGVWRYRTDLPEPKPGPGEVRIRVAAAGICGTDVHVCRGDESLRSVLRPPVILGHEFCGVIDETGSGVAGLRPGDYVSAEMHVVCRECPACRDGKFHACARTLIRGLHADGCFAEAVVMPAGNVVKLPESLPRTVAAFLDPLGNAVHMAGKAGIEGRSVLISGFGAIGAMAAEVVAFLGAREILITDVNPGAIANAEAFAARRSGAGKIRVLRMAGSLRAPSVKSVLEDTGGGVDVALEISGHPDGINDTLRMVRHGGEVVLLGIPKDEAVTIQEFARNVIFKGLTLHAVIGREMFRTWDRMLDLLGRGLDVSSIVTSELPLAEFGEALRRIGAGTEQKVVLHP